VGCHACAIACKEWNASGTIGPLSDYQPYGAEPSGVWFNRIRHYEMDEYPNNKTVNFPMSCMHCEDADCVTVCPTGASYKRPEDGVVLIDQRECRGYRRCLEACPYKRILYRPNTRVSEKCVGCFPRLEGADSGGVAREAACMAACVGQVRLQGFLKLDRNGAPVEERDNPLYYLIHAAKIALPLYPQFGTLSNGYYIPPRWVPRPFLKQMFGPGVARALERYTVPDRELLAVLQLFRKTDRVIFGYKIEKGAKVSDREANGQLLELFDDTVIALGKDGQELFRTRVQPNTVSSF
jgi:nitrate reductase beta subunit